ncbi:MAG TPA: hypothetical protein VLC09_10305, partial [Polyangiaceae bacterium]|nr:hypothetical protein [Polyangiaceae bacterium]
MVGGCSCEDERPYTPFTVATGQTQADDAPATAAGPTNQPAQFLEAPADATTWSAFGRQLVAPSGSKFHWAALYGDPASAEARLLTWTLGPPASGGLWLHGLDGKPTRHLLRSPSFLPQGGDCRESTRFLPGTALTATLDIRRSCASRLLPGSPERALVLLDVARPEPFVFGLRLLATPEGESFDFSAESVDLDGDGQNDVVAHFRARRLSGSTEKTSEKDDEKIALHWLARPAGPSRQKDTPSQEFVKRTKALVVSAQRKAERASVPTAVDALRRLYTAVCAESAAPRVLDWEGAPLACGGMDEGLKQLTTAAVHAELGLGRPARALGELTRADWYGSSPLNDAQRAALTKVALAKVPSGSARKQGEFRPALVARPTAPSLPRLHFDDASTLWALGPE